MANIVTLPVTLLDGTVPVAADFMNNFNALNTATIPVANGGTGLTAGTSGGVPYFSSTSAITSSGALTANAVVIGGGAGAAPSTIAALTTNQVLVGTTGSAPAGATTLAGLTLTTPTIGSFTNATHTHQNAAGGGTLDAAAIAAGTMGTARLGSGSASASTFLRGDSAWAAVGSALTRAGGNTTEGTIANASDGDILTVSSLSIAVGTPFIVVCSIRKTAGAAAAASIGLKLNTTIVSGGQAWSSATNQAESGIAIFFFGAHDASYLSTGVFLTAARLNDSFVRRLATADIPNATITDVVIHGNSGNALNTMGVDEVHVYTLATS